MRDPELPPPRGVKRRPTADRDAKSRPLVGPLLSEQVNPGDARWCEEHRRLECTRRSRPKPDGDQTCHRNAIRGIDHCSKHVGNRSAQVAKMIGEAQITAWSAINRSNGGVAAGANLDPGQAVMGMLQMSWLRAAAYGELLRKQVALETAQRRAIEGEVVDEDGEPLSADGLIGHKFSATTSGQIYATSEEVRALVQLEASERDRIVSYAEKAHKMGISERMTSMAEQWSDVVAGRVVAMLDDLELTPAQQARVPMLVQAHLAAIDISGAAR